MKLKIIFVLSLLVISLFSFPFFAALNPSDLSDKLSSVTETISQDHEDARNFLKDEWTKILGENDFGRFVLFINESIKKLNPFFEVMLGIEYSLSWLFFLTLVLWIVLITYIYRAFHLYGFFSDLAGLGISLGIGIIISLMGIPRVLAELIVWFIGLQDSLIFQIILIIILFLLFILAGLFAKELESFFKQIKKSRERNRNELNKMQEEFDRATLNTTAEAVREGFSYSHRMKRGGQKSNRGRFVSKAATERYAKMYGDEAAKKRFRND